MSKPSYAKTDIKALSPITSKPGTLALLHGQAQYLIALIEKLPTKGVFAAHKSRVVAVGGPQMGDWAKARDELIKDYALTELVNSEDPASERRLLIYTDDEIASMTAAVVAGTASSSFIPSKGEAKFADESKRIAFIKAAEEFTKELLITWDVGSSANLWKAVQATYNAFHSDGCPAIDDRDIFSFERLLEEIEISLTPVPTK